MRTGRTAVELAGLEASVQAGCRPRDTLHRRWTYWGIAMIIKALIAMLRGHFVPFSFVSPGVPDWEGVGRDAPIRQWHYDAHTGASTAQRHQGRACTVA